MPYTLKSNDFNTIKTYTVGLNKDIIYAFDECEVSWIEESDESGYDTIQFIFIRHSNTYRLTFGRRNINYQINGINIWTK